jgi:hypothetical protein
MLSVFKLKTTGIWIFHNVHNVDQIIERQINLLFRDFE